ncbi:MAG: catalase family protein [Candidatus Sericytochromatia bacterium]
MITRVCLVSASVLLLAACQSTSAQRNLQTPQQAQNVRANRSLPPPIDVALGEQQAPNEQAMTERIETVILQGMQKQKAAFPQTRDVHAKHHGCVKAFFEVHPDKLPPAQRVGVLARPQRFASWVRFSNGSGAPKPDSEGDIRGMAIKLMGVPGTKLLESESQAQTQDFLLINTPRFFIDDLNDYVKFIQATTAGGAALAGFAVTHPGVMYQIYQIFKQPVTNPLETEFFSTTPYKLGNTASKYRARPCRTGLTPMPAQPGPNFLRENMAKSLQQQGSCFEFMVQLRTDPASMPVEDATVAWSEQKAPWIPVATLQIPAQSFDSPRQMGFCENLSFTPWHSLPEHKPLGAPNRVRKSVYELVSRFRHATNGVPPQEPSGHDLL